MQPDPSSNARQARRAARQSRKAARHLPPGNTAALPAAPGEIAALAQSQPFALLDLLRDAALLVDRDWRVVAGNAAAGLSSKHTASTQDAPLLWDAWPALAGEPLAQRLRRAMNERVTVDIAHHGHHAQQEEIWLDVRAAPFADGLAIVLHDATAQRRTERALRHNEDRLRRALDATGALVYELDLATDQVEVAGNTVPMTGYRPDEIPTMEAWWKAQVNPEDHERILAEFRAMIARGDDRFVAEYRFRRRDGAERHVWDHGIIVRDAARRKVGTIGTIVDITERKRREERAGMLQELTAALSATVDSADAAAVIIERVMPALGANAGNVYLLNDDGRELVSIAALGYEPAVLASSRRLPLHGETMMAEVARGGAPILLNTWDERLRRYPHHRHVHASGGDRAVAGLPLKVEGRTIGALSLAFPTDRAFDGDERRLMATVADLCAQTLERTRLYEALRRSEAQARLVTDRAPTYLAHIDTESRYLYVNRAYAERFGLTPEAIIGRTMPQVIGEAAYAVVQEQIATALSGQEVEFDATVPYAGIGARFVQVALAPERDERGRVRGVIAVVSDATERQQAEAARRFLAELGRTLASSLNAAETLRRVARLVIPLLADSCVIDMVQPDGQIRRVAWAHGDPDEQRLIDEHLALADAQMLPAEHPIARTIVTGEARVVADVADAWLQRSAFTPAHLAFLRGRRLRSQMTVPLSARGRTLGALTLYRVGDSAQRYAPADLALALDLAERTALAADNARLYAEALEAEAKVRRLLDAGVVGIMVADGERIIDANDHFLAMVGYPREALPRGLLRWPAMTPPGFEHLDARALAELDEQGVCTPYEKEFFRRDGSRLPILIGAAVLQREPTQWVCFILDLTEQKRAENEWRAFIDATAHDLRNPLTTVLGQTQLMQRRLRRLGALQPTDIDERLTTIAAAATRAAGLIDDLIDTARLRANQPLEMHPGPVDLVSLATACASEASRVGPSHTVRVQTSEASLEVVADARRIERVIRNILDNAIKYSPAGGEVNVRVARDAAGPGESAVVAIEDHGLGIPASDLQHVFERFRRGGNVEGQIEGSGIGLTGAQQIVAQHGGEIAVESTEGVGSTFTLRLPLQPPA